MTGLDSKKLLLFSGILLVAAAAGAGSEVLAQRTTETLSFRGGNLVAHWVDFAAEGHSEAQVWATEAATQGRSEPSPTVFVSATHWTPTSNNTFWSLSQSTPPDRVVVDRRLAFGRVDAEIPGTAKTWTAAEDWSAAEPVTVSVIVDLLAEGRPMHEDGQRRTFDRASGVMHQWTTRGTLVEASGSGAIHVDGVPIVPSGTPVSWAEMRNTRQGSMESHEVKSRTPRE